MTLSFNVDEVLKGTNDIKLQRKIRSSSGYFQHAREKNDSNSGEVQNPVYIHFQTT